MALFPMAMVPLQVCGEILPKQQLLDAQTFWDNRDGEWFRNNIPFFECPDEGITTTYYYRWELVTKHLTYGSPNSGYSFTEFMDRPFWSGAFGAISCPVGHQLYELRWLRDPVYVRDYSRYWFRTPGAQPRNYGCWLADGIWATHQVHPDDGFMKDLLPDLKKNYEEWEKRQFVPEVGLFWQNGHDEGMEFNINSRQTMDILRGAPGYRPSFNAYMWADARAIARTARMSGDVMLAEAFEKRAEALKKNVQEKLWDPRRGFYFPMSMREEKDKEGHVVKALTLTYQSGQFAGSEHGRELHGYVPWQFQMLDPGRESAWKFLIDPEYFQAPFGPVTVERHDPLFVLKDSCCWWSGQSWPYATAQTLKAMANVLHNIPQETIKREDYLALLKTFSQSHRKNGLPYLAEALHPDTGLFDGHDAYNHSEHYFHSSFNDLIITGLVGLKTRDDELLELDPLAPASWPYFAIDDVPYRGRLLTILWDAEGIRYKRGKGLRVLCDGKEIVAQDQLKKVMIAMPPAKMKADNKELRFNYAVNNEGDAFPRFSASLTAPNTSLDKICDGQAWYTIHPPNRWTAEGSKNVRDFIEVDFGTERPIDLLRLAWLDDGKIITVPSAFELHFNEGGKWQKVELNKNPEPIMGYRFTSYSFPLRSIRGLRVTMAHASGAFSGLSELEAWGPGKRPYIEPPPKPGNLAYNPTGKGFPQASASFHDVYGGIPALAIDGRYNHKPNPVNRWTSYGSNLDEDWFEVDFGMKKNVRRIELHLYDDKGGVQAPKTYRAQSWQAGHWLDIPQQSKTPSEPLGGACNTLQFPVVETQKVRIIFTNKAPAKSGLTEIEIWEK